MHKAEITMTRVYRRSLLKLGAIAACMGITQPEALDRILDEAVAAKRIPIESSDSRPVKRKVV